MTSDVVARRQAGVPLIVLAIVSFALAPLFARFLMDKGLRPEMVAAYRYILPGVLMLPFLGLRPSKLAATFLGLAAGAAVGLGWIAFAATLGRADVGEAAVYYFAYAPFLLVLSWPLLGRIPGTWMGIAGIAALAAIFFQTGGEIYRLADLERLGMAVAAPAALAFSMAIVRGWLGPLSPLQRIAALSVGACLGIAPVVLLRHPIDTLAPLAEDYALILALGILATLLPQLVYIIVAPWIGTTRAAAIGALELPVIIGLAWLLLGQVPGESMVIGAALVIASIVVLALSSTHWGRPPGA